MSDPLIPAHIWWAWLRGTVVPHLAPWVAVGLLFIASGPTWYVWACAAATLVAEIGINLSHDLLDRTNRYHVARQERGVSK